MASIKIDSDLQPIGSELFLDAESYLDELSADQQINNIVGGTKPTFTRPTIIRPTTTFPTTFPTTSPVINPVSVVVG
ncbi:hypothetical protein [Microcystis aeruginosa]|uniref:hypothetical protein n=1 Tax=Microcystis aeruginosa TaxID=1126 RepID=UPI00232C196C|nr:hypothetical protein [Microcystis aeruginosa]MDB9417044.1 hypothetical protein [Microcystis aeruginosa CS-556/03]